MGASNRGLTPPARPGGAQPGGGCPSSPAGGGGLGGGGGASFSGGFFFASQNAEITVDLRHQGTKNPTLKLGYARAEAVEIPSGIHAIVVHRVDAGNHDVSCTVFG